MPAWSDRAPDSRSLQDAPAELRPLLAETRVAVKVPDRWRRDGRLFCARSPLGLGTCLEVGTSGLNVGPDGLVRFSTPIQKGEPVDLVLRDEGGGNEQLVLTVDPTLAEQPFVVQGIDEAELSSSEPSAGITVKPDGGPETDDPLRRPGPPPPDGSNPTGEK